jgi:hypothetical protein
LTCGQRGCPLCERLQARERVERVASAAARVADATHARAPRAAAELLGQLGDAVAARDRWTGLQAAARARFESGGRQRDAERAEGHGLRAARAEVRRARLRRWATEAARPQAWRWRLITVSPPWNPRDPREVTSAGLRRRVDDLRARVTGLWESALSVGGLASMTSRVEINNTGHVHAHMLYFGPYQAATHLRRLAGCVVDVRAVQPTAGLRGVVLDRGEVRAGGVDLLGAVREVVKYALKSPGGGAREWLAGGRRRVAHPQLVAAWIVATDGAQLVAHRGVMRDALRAADLCDEQREPPGLAPRVCPCCGASVAEVGEVWSVARLAATLPQALWRERVRWIRDG